MNLSKKNKFLKKWILAAVALSIMNPNALDAARAAEKKINVPPLIQYKTFNNTSDGYYPEGGTPTHGSYATIGIENLYGNEGLQYTFNNQYALGASPLFNNRAILITTELPTFSILGDINNDELINVLDIVLLVNLVLAGSFNEYADIKGDSILNVLDIVLLVNIILESGL